MQMTWFQNIMADCTDKAGTCLISQVGWLSGEPDYFGRKKISSGGDLSHYSSASLY